LRKRSMSSAELSWLCPSMDKDLGSTKTDVLPSCKSPWNHAGGGRSPLCGAGGSDSESFKESGTMEPVNLKTSKATCPAVGEMDWHLLQRAV
jgi:hypothetical protein